jgi:hypothetical protein
MSPSLQAPFLLPGNSIRICSGVSHFKTNTYRSRYDQEENEMMESNAKVPEIYAGMVFNDKVMRERLP